MVLKPSLIGSGVLSRERFFNIFYVFDWSPFGDFSYGFLSFYTFFLICYIIFLKDFLLISFFFCTSWLLCSSSRVHIILLVKIIE